MRKKHGLVLLLTLILVACVLCPVHAQTVTLRWMMYGTPEQQYVYEMLARDFETLHPGIKVELMPLISSGVYRERLLTLFTAGEAPDVFLTFAQYRDAFIDMGLLYDLTGFFDRSDLVSRDMYYPAIRHVIEVDGRIWGTPWSYNAKLFVLNADVREQQGLAPPDPNWTIDDFALYARRMTNPQRGFIGVDAASSLSNSAGSLGWMYNFTGHYWVDPHTRDVHVDDPGMIQMLEYWLELQNVYEAASGYTIPRPAGGVRGGLIGMYETWSTEPHFLATLTSAEDFRWELATFPVGPVSDSHFAQGHLWSIPFNHPNPAAAWKFVEYLGSYRAEELWAKLQRTPPQVHDPELWEMYFGDVPPGEREQLIRFILNDLYAAGRARTFTYWTEFAEMEVLTRQAIDRVMRQQESPTAVMENLARTFRALLGGR